MKHTLIQRKKVSIERSEMNRLWAPWRMAYIKKSKLTRCIFCILNKPSSDEKNLVVFRGKYSFVIMNRYPYNNGHLMVAPYRHIGMIEKLNEDEIREIFSLIQKSIKVLKPALKAPGFNIGANIGRVAGAGVVDHFHIHIVPRFFGDVNFLPIIANTKVINEYLKDTYRNLKPYFRDIV